MEELNTKDQDLSKRSMIDISSKTFEQLLDIGMDINHLYILEALAEGTDLSLHINSPKVLGWKQTLLRKGYIDIKEGITEAGKELLSSVGSGKLSIVKASRKLKKEKIVDSFDLWWKAYPGTDQFKYKDISFRGTRSLRVKQDECALKLTVILSKGEYTIEEMIEAIEIEKLQKMEESVRVRQNKMSYFLNSLSYLNQRIFEPYIELIRSTPKGELNKSENTAVKRIDI